MRKLSRTPSPHEVTVRISGIAAIPAVLEQLGADPDAVFARARVDRALFDDPANHIGIVTVGRLVRECINATGCEHFGLLVGQQGGPQSFGLIGLAVRYSPDVATALRRLGAYQHLYHGGQTIALEVHDDVALLRYAVTSPGVDALDQIDDGALAIFFNVFRSLCGPGWLPLEVRFAHRRPENLRPFVRFFQTTLAFDSEQSALVFSANWLRKSLPPVDPDLDRLLQQQIRRLEGIHGASFPDQVRGALRTGLLSGHSSAEQVAALFSMHRRTLTRRLATSGLSFAALVDEGRFEISRRMLEQTTLDVKRIAAALDYAEASAFSRAFHRWSGMTPTEWRARHRSEPGLTGAD
jgi:AraC-like DNA-binding protein